MVPRTDTPTLTCASCGATLSSAVIRGLTAPNAAPSETLFCPACRQPLVMDPHPNRPA